MYIKFIPWYPFKILPILDEVMASYNYSDSKDPRIDINQISILRESVGSMAYRCWSYNLCYLGLCQLETTRYKAIS